MMTTGTVLPAALSAGPGEEESLSVITTTAGVTSTSVWDASFPGEDWSGEISELRS